MSNERQPVDLEPIAEAIRAVAWCSLWAWLAWLTFSYWVIK